METKFIAPQRLREALGQFIGTEHYYQHHSAGKASILLTDGCKYLAEQAGCYWLFDIISSYQGRTEIRNTPLQVWILKKQGNDWIVTCEDGNHNQLAKQDIPFSDFPLDEI